MSKNEGYKCDDCLASINFCELGLLSSLDKCSSTSSMITLCLSCRDERLNIELRNTMPDLPVEKAQDYKYILSQYTDENIIEKNPILELLLKSKIERN